jgi:hypothetical protein
MYLLQAATNWMNIVKLVLTLTCGAIAHLDDNFLFLVGFSREWKE